MAKIFTLCLLWLITLILILSSNQGNLNFSILSSLFLCVFFIGVEYLNINRIHPVQYLLSLCSFPITDLMFRGINVYLSFDWSYSISASALIILISLYSTTCFRQLKASAILTVLLSLSYIIYYVIVIIPDAGLLVGSLFAFILLALVMYYTRNLNFYKEKESIQNESRLNESIQNDSSALSDQE